MNPKRLAVLLLAIAQILTSYFGGFDGQGSTYDSPIISPAGYAFSIWGVITLGCVIYGIYQFLPAQKNKKVFDALSIPLSVVFIGFCLWIFAAARELLWLTVFIFLGMLIGLWTAYPHIKNIKKWQSFESMLIKGTFELYLGWSTAAFPLNIVTALVKNGVIYADARSTFLYVVILLLILGFCLWGQRRIGKNYYYTAAIIWAFIGVAVGSVQEGSFILPLVSIVAAISTGMFAYINHSRIAT